MKVRIGINPLTWSNDDLPSLGKDISLETCLSEAAAAGYEGVELGHKFPRKPQILGPLLDKHGLALVSGWYSMRLLERNAKEEFAAMQPHSNCCRRSAAM
jgi:inosose dehydratase